MYYHTHRVPPEERKYQKKGIKCIKISNISCFVHYRIEPLVRRCHLKVFTRIRPGYIEYYLRDIDPKNFNLDDQLRHMRLEI